MELKLCLKGKFLLVLCFFFLLSVNLILAVEKEDPELKTCQHQCRHQKRFDDREKRECEKRCEEYIKEKQRRQHDEQHSNWKEKEEEEEETHADNPYLFEHESWTPTIEEEHGAVNVLERFSRKSKLLKGIDNFRVSILELNRKTFSMPNHWDAESVSFVLSGSGTISIVTNNKTETFNIKRGDILRMSAGTIVYLVNHHEHDKLQIIDFVHAFSVPSHFETFFGPGGKRNPQSFFRAFDTEILSSAFNVPRETLEGFFEEVTKRVFQRVSEQQIKELSKDASSSDGGDKKPYNLFDKRPSISNAYGELYEVKPHEFNYMPEPELDVGVSFINVSRRAMGGMCFNTRAVMVSLVQQGKGRFEIVCPHQQHRRKRKEGESEPRYHRVRGLLSPGRVFVTLAGHPMVVEASSDEDLQIVSFEIYSENNQRVPLAGKGNLIQQFDKEAKELSFGMPEKEVDEVFNSRRESYFFPGPHYRHGRDHHA